MPDKLITGRVKADTETTDGTFEALAATYDVDSVGDKIIPGAFGKSLGEWQSSGDPIPVYWSHQHNDAFANIGSVTRAEERDEGLWIEAKLDVAPAEENMLARQVYRLIKGGRIRDLSFAYEVQDAAPDDDDDSVQDLRQLKLYEVGPCLIGANQQTRFLAVKAALGVGSGPTSTSEETWDGPGMEARLSNDAGADTYRKAYAWVDPEGDPDAKASYRFIHHMIGTDGSVGAANMRACSTAIGVLNGGRGGTTIPDADRQGVYNHLAAHLRAGSMEPPELASLDSDDDTAAPALSVASAVVDISVKAGRVLSAKNEADLREASRLIDGVLTQVTDNDQGKAHPDAPTKIEDPAVGKIEESNRPGPAGALAFELTLLDLGG